MLQSHNGIPHSDENEWAQVTTNDMAKSHKHTAEGKNLDAK